MQGEITAYTEPGKGSVLTAVLCLQKHNCSGYATACNVSEPRSTSDSSIANGAILLVEDYAPSIIVASMMLEDLGYDVTGVTNGKEAIDIIVGRDQVFLAILMDVQMHDMDGLETTRRIRELERQKGYRHTIIGVTAHALAGDRERCISAGMDDYISKPIQPDILAAKLRRLSAVVA